VKTLGALATAGLCALAAPANPPQVFRASTHAVAVDVAVFDGGRTAPALSPGDFEIEDNGVRQRLVAGDQNSLPIDLRLVFDTSGSMTETDLDRYRRAMQRVTATLRPEDRCEIVTFTARIADAARRQSAPVTIDLRRFDPPTTAFFDAVSLALVTVPASDRRQIVIVLSDAQDNASFFDEATLMDAAQRTDAVVYSVVAASSRFGASPFVARLQSLSLLTGGRQVAADRDDQIGAVIVDALDEFRHGYVLRYVLQGVPLEGWHALHVTVRGPRRYSVRARAGYFGSE
jgi:VWFA-related protein